MTFQREPSVAMREDVHGLITESFAEHLAPLISMAIDAAYAAENQSIRGADVSNAYIYEDQARGTFADLATCRLWTSALSPEFLEDNKKSNKGFEHIFGAEKTPDVVSAVLWRLLPCWEGSQANDHTSFVPKGPVLEVLFLAACPQMRELGHSKELVAELEIAAKQMGCCAVAVAAVPQQGRSFWKKCGYEVVVPLKDGECDETGQAPGIRSKKEGPGLDEPNSAFGAFLVENMLLFTDTPLVAKTLSC